MTPDFTMDYLTVTTNVCSSTPTMINYNTNPRTYYNLDNFQTLEQPDLESNDNVNDDDDGLFEIEDVETSIYGATTTTTTTTSSSTTTQELSNSLPSLMLDNNNNNSNNTITSDDEFDDDLDDIYTDTSSINNNQIKINNLHDTWNQSILSPCLYPAKTSYNNNNSKRYSQSRQFSFDSILSKPRSKLSPFTNPPILATLNNFNKIQNQSVAADNYNLWLSSN